MTDESELRKTLESAVGVISIPADHRRQLRDQITSRRNRSRRGTLAVVGAVLAVALALPVASTFGGNDASSGVAAGQPVLLERKTLGGQRLVVTERPPTDVLIDVDGDISAVGSSDGTAADGYDSVSPVGDPALMAVTGGLSTGSHTTTVLIVVYAPGVAKVDLQALDGTVLDSAMPTRDIAVLAARGDVGQVGGRLVVKGLSAAGSVLDLRTIDPYVQRPHRCSTNPSTATLPPTIKDEPSVADDGLTARPTAPLPAPCS